MDFKVFTKVFTLLGLSLAFALTLVTTDVHVAVAQAQRPPTDVHVAVAQAQRPPIGRCSKPPCYINGAGGRKYGDGRLPSPEEIADLENLVKSGRATIDQQLLLAYTYQVQGKYALAQELYSTGLELAKKAGDLEGQAIAYSSRGEVYAATGNLKEAASQLTLATGIYQRLGNVQRVSELNQRSVEINKQLQANPSRIQIDPSRIQIDPSRIQIDPSRIQIDPSRIQIQK